MVRVRGSPHPPFSSKLDAAASVVRSITSTKKRRGMSRLYMFVVLIIGGLGLRVGVRCQICKRSHAWALEKSAEENYCGAPARSAS